MADTIFCLAFFLIVSCVCVALFIARYSSPVIYVLSNYCPANMAVCFPVYCIIHNPFVFYCKLVSGKLCRAVEGRERER